jgi:hypothetical protein
MKTLGNLYMKKLFLLIAALFTASAAMAANPSQRKLISSDVRPTPAEIMSKKQHFANINPKEFGNLANLYGRDIPIVIVSLEKAFPGGTYAFLGRDMDLVADAVEAFYLSIGQKDRVQRIRFSTPSMQGATPQLITDFLIQSGLNADPEVHKPPMVIVDYTSFAGGSQSTTIVKKTLKELENRGVPAYDVMNRLNIATIHARPTPRIYNIINMPIEEIDEKLEAQNMRWMARHNIDAIFQIPVNSIAYGSEWHDRYGPIVRNADGLLETKTSNYFSYQTKELVYEKMAAAIMIATTKNFKRSVTELAVENSVQIAGLDTPAVVRTSVQKTPEEITALINEATRQNQAAELVRAEKAERLLKVNLERLPGALYPRSDFSASSSYAYVMIGKQRAPLSGNANYVSNILKRSSFGLAPHYQELVLNTLVDLFNSKRIAASDLQNLFMTTLRFKKITDPDLIKVIQAHAQNVKPLQNVFDLPEFREKYLKLDGVMGDNYRIIANQGVVALSCQKVLLNN